MSVTELVGGSEVNPLRRWTLAGISPTNVRFGSKADIPRPTHLRPLLGVKQT
ncbi:MAG: hypothetical protein V3R80_05340 [Candidatus Tectomicrobia bacterium]